MAPNTLYYGDNLAVIRENIPDEAVDLIYLDPPFNSQATYNILFKAPTGAQSHAQVEAFEDAWHWGDAAEWAYAEVMKSGRTDAAELLRAMRSFLKENDMMAYLAMMAVRLIELHRVLKPSGSLYLHCDPTASHYLKILLDAIFRPNKFLNELVWQRTSARNDPARYGRVHDAVLFYAKGDSHIWNRGYEGPDEEYFAAHDFQRDERGHLYRNRDLTAPAHGQTSGQFEWKEKRPPKGRMWSYTKEKMERLDAEGRIVYTTRGMPRLKIPAEDLKGVPFQDVWTSPSLWLNSAAIERLGYPTQKPLALLKRIIIASSNEGDVVLDPFCGCGTAIHAAPFGGRKRGADTGIDGLIYFYDFNKKGAVLTEKTIVSVKGGEHVNVGMIRDLAHVVARENARMGLFVTLAQPTDPMRTEALKEGYYETSSGGRYLKLQVVTIEDLLNGKKPDLPPVERLPFPKAPQEPKLQGKLL